MDAPKDRNERGNRKAAAGGDAASSTSGPSGTLPLKTGTLLKCRWKDGTLHPAEIIECRQTPSGEPHGYEYYVHYTEFDRRLDQWVNLEQLDLNPVDTDVYAEAQKMMTRRQKWKMKASKENLVDAGTELELGKTRSPPMTCKTKSYSESGVVAPIGSFDDQVSSFGQQKWSTQRN